MFHRLRYLVFAALGAGLAVACVPLDPAEDPGFALTPVGDVLVARGRHRQQQPPHARPRVGGTSAGPYPCAPFRARVH